MMIGRVQNPSPCIHYSISGINMMFQLIFSNLWCLALYALILGHLDQALTNSFFVKRVLIPRAILNCLAFTLLSGPGTSKALLFPLCQTLVETLFLLVCRDIISFHIPLLFGFLQPRALLKSLWMDLTLRVLISVGLVVLSKIMIVLLCSISTCPS